MIPEIDLDFRGTGQTIYTLLLAYMYKVLCEQRNFSTTVYYGNYSYILERLQELSITVGYISTLRSEGCLTTCEWENISRLKRILEFRDKFVRLINEFFPDFKNIVLIGDPTWRVTKDLSDVGIKYEIKKK